MSSFETILVERPEPSITRIVMNRPDARNAQNLQMTYDLNAAFDAAVLIAYLLPMIGIGAWARYRARHRAAYIVAGRRLGPVMYTSTMSAVILGGAATVGGVGLGYSLGAAGVWMITAIAAGVAMLSLLFAVVIRRSRVYTLPELVERRYGHLTARMSAWVMVAYTFLITTTSTLAYGSVLSVVFGIGRLQAIGIGAAVVVIYSLLGGMWSITLTDIVQFTVMTLAFFVLLGPASLQGGSVEALNRLGGEFLDPGSVGFASIFGTFVIYTLGLLLGQDIWQRVATARTPGIARWGGFASAIYVTLFGIVTTFIGMTAAVKWPGIENRDAVFAIAVGELLPQGLAGLALSGAVAAMMSTTSGGLIATATVLREDILPTLSPRYAVPGGGRAPIDTTMRVLVAVLGVLAAAPALVLNDVVTALFQPFSFTALGSTGTSAEVPFESTGLTLSQALGRVGGLKEDRADIRGAFIFRLEDPNALDPAIAASARRTPDGRIPVIYRIDLGDPATFFAAQSFPMQDKDVLYVSRAPLADLQRFVSIVASMAFPFINLTNRL